MRERVDTGAEPITQPRKQSVSVDIQPNSKRVISMEATVMVVSTSSFPMMGHGKHLLEFWQRQLRFGDLLPCD